MLRSAACCDKAPAARLSGNCGFAGFGIWVRGCSSAISARNNLPYLAVVGEERIFRSSSVASRIS